MTADVAVTQIVNIYVRYRLYAIEENIYEAHNYECNEKNGSMGAQFRGANKF